MKISNNIKIASAKNTVVTIGTFDGVHIGHQKIVKRLIDSAKKEELESVILTFFPHPRMVLQTDADIKLINTINERANILENLGLDHLYVKTFTKEFSRLTAEEFVEQILVNKLKAKKIIIGYDHQFGRNRKANIKDLIRFGKFYGFDVEEISAQDIDEVSVSSTKIRKALNQGDVKLANSYLGYLFMLSGSIVKGKALGRKIGFPTANLQIKEDYKLIPKDGAYVVNSNINGEEVFGMMNIGINPTVEGDSRSIEIHFFDFEKDIYGKNLQINVLQRIRDEQKFGSLEKLKSQLKLDKRFSLSYIKQYNAQ